MAVHVRVADVVILFRVELSLDQIKLVLQHGEGDGYVVFHPDALLIADYPIGATADNVAQIFRPAHHLHGDVARRGAELGVTTPVNQTLYALVKLLEEAR